MLLQTLSQQKVTSETPWHDEASNGGAYRDRLKMALGGYFEHDDHGTMQPKPEIVADPGKGFPDALRLVDDDGQVLETYTVADLQRDTDMTIVAPPPAEQGD